MKLELESAARRQASAAIRASRDGIANAANEAFLDRHPEWRERYGEAAVRRGVEDACFHIDFLVSALEVGDSAPFESYGRWVTRVLTARGMTIDSLVEHLECISAIIADRGFAPAEDVRKLIEAATSAARSVQGQEPTASDIDELRESRDIYTQAILSGNRAAALGVLETALDDGVSHLDLYADILQEAQYEVGRLWQSNEISVAREHMATSITQFALTRVFERLPPATKARGSAVVTGVEGELHQVGANIIADAWEADGWSVRFLGTQMPHRGILEIVEEDPPDVLGISTTLFANVSRTARLIEEVRASLGDRVPRVIVGGGAFRKAPWVAKEIGADLVAGEVRIAVREVAAAGA